MRQNIDKETRLSPEMVSYDDWNERPRKLGADVADKSIKTESPPWDGGIQIISLAFMYLDRYDCSRYNY